MKARFAVAVVAVLTMGVSEQIFGTKSLHGQDYGLWYVNIQRNIADRIASYQAAK